MSTRRPWAWPLVPAYSAAVAAKDLLRAAGLLRARRLAWPVISIGSVSAGGAGKTPVAIALGKLLAERGWVVDVLSRGYGRSGRMTERVDPTQPEAAARYGDEPVLIAERAHIPVWVGRNRYTAGRAAENRSLQTRSVSPPAWQGDGLTEEDCELAPMCAHLLDDGLQHRGLARQFELVVVTEEDLGDTLLPAGNLREPLSALRRAHAFAVREEELDAVAARLHQLAGREVPLWTLRRTLHFPAPLGVFGAGLRPLAFCALARPEGFAAMLGKAGCGLVDTVVFPDHHRYSADDLHTLIRVARQLQATGFLTTEKDAVKLDSRMRAQLESEIGPVVVVQLEVNFVYESPVVRTLEGRLRAALELTHVEARVP